MIRKIKNKEKIDFLLQNKHYKKLHLYLYILSVILIVLVYFITIFIFSSFSKNYIISAIFSFIIGIYLVYNRDKLTQKISEKLESKKREKIKKENKKGLKTTLRRIRPENKSLKLNIRPKESFKIKINKIKNKFSKKNKNKKTPDYIEIE